MEAVLKVRFPGIVMPWREMMRGCLVILLFGILYLCVQNCAERNEAVKPAAVCSEAEHRIVWAIRKTGPSEICENMRLIAADIRNGLALPGSALTWNISEMVSVPGLTESREFPVFDYFVVPDDGIEDMKRTESVIIDGLGIPGESMIPEGGVDPGESVVPEAPVDPGESIVPEAPVDPGESIVPEAPVDSGESVVPEGSVNPGESVVPEAPVDSGESVMPEESVDPGESVVPGVAAIPEEIAGFLLDEEGYVAGCTERVVVMDGLLFIPGSDSCVGIRSGALDELGEFVTEVYLPANISDIGSGTFDAFPYLMFVEVSGDNPYYYSLDGILYSTSGEEIFYPAGRTIE